MEATSSRQDSNTHAASLLAYLNHQRSQGLFCDCVIRQRQNSDQLYHAHRCVLAASSPVLASILSSSGALVELEDPNLLDSVLPSLLDYIYTGALPYPLSQQDYYRLFSAACHMQMKELQGALRAIWPQIEADAVDDKSSSVIAEMHPFKETRNTYKNDLKILTEVPSSPTGYSFQKVETMTQQKLNEEILEEVQVNSVATPSIENDERSSRKQYANVHTRTDSATLNDSNTFGIPENIDRGNTSDYRHVTSLTRDSVRQKADKSNLHDISGVIHYTDVDVSHSSDFLKPDIRPRTPEEKLLSALEDRKRYSLSSSSSPPLSSGAVPVICHSSKAAVMESLEISAGPPSLSNMAYFSLSVGMDNINTTDAITTETKYQNREQNQAPRSTIRHSTCATGHKVNKDYNSNNVHPFKLTEDTWKTSSYITNKNNENAHEDSLQSQAKYLRDYLVMNNDSRRDLKHQIKSDFDPVLFKHQRLDCFECQKTLLTTATEEDLKGQGVVLSLPMEPTDSRSNSNCEESFEVEVKGEHSYPSRCLALTDVETNLCKTSGPKTDWLHKFCKDHKNIKDDVSSEHENKINSTKANFTFIASQSGLVNVTDSFSSSKCCNVLEVTKSSRLETSFIAPMDNNSSGTSRPTTQPYHWHHSYQNKPNKDALPQNSHDKHSKPGLFTDADELNDGHNTDSFAFIGQQSLSHYFPVEAEDQSDINTKQKEVHVPNQHRSTKEEKQFVIKETAAIMSHTAAQTNQGYFTARAGSFDEYDKPRDSNERTPVHIKQCRAEVWVTQNSDVLEVSEPDKGKTIISATPVCSPLSEPNSDQLSNPSSVSVCIPSTLPASMPTDRSVHLSSPNHQPFQCSLCDRSFSQKGSLNRHVRSHLGVRPFPCPCCPMTFSRQYRVTEHMRVHQRCALGNGLQKTPESSVINSKERPQN